MSKYDAYHSAGGVSAVPTYSADMAAAPLADLTDSQEKVGVYEGGSGQKQIDQPGGPGTPMSEGGQTIPQEVGDTPGVGSRRPPGIGNAGGGPGNGAAGSGAAIAQGKVVGSGPVNVGASGEGETAVPVGDYLSRNEHNDSVKMGRTIPNPGSGKETSVDTSQLLGQGMVD